MRNLIPIALFLLLQSCVARADSEKMSHRVNGKFAPDVQDVQESTKQEYACDCCQKCKAARKPVQPDLQEDSTRKNGCDDCCQKCGRPVQPAPEQIPPEIIQKPRQK